MLGYLLLYVCMSGFIHNDYKVYLVLNILVYSFASVFLQVARGVGIIGYMQQQVSFQH